MRTSLRQVDADHTRGDTITILVVRKVSRISRILYFVPRLFPLYHLPPPTPKKLLQLLLIHPFNVKRLFYSVHRTFYGNIVNTRRLYRTLKTLFASVFAARFVEYRAEVSSCAQIRNFHSSLRGELTADKSESQANARDFLLCTTGRFIFILRRPARRDSRGIKDFPSLLRT